MTPLDDLFPGLRASGFRVTSPADERYNCIARAVRETGQWLWPGPPNRADWPAEVPRQETVEAFEALFHLYGFSPCQTEAPEDGIEKVALFADANGVPSHAARQLSNGRWTSKLGMSEDIEHDLHAIAGAVYGRVVRIYGRPAPA